jgi:ppGpp synthetase/RelA/SpoT-type nucleotidyltranferase
MARAVPLFPRSQVNAAGDGLLDPPTLAVEYDHVLEIVNNWRAAHSYPLNAMHMTLKGRTRAIDLEGDTGQRIKRLRSITDKLRRFPKMTLTQMQDIGGCRAIVTNCPMVYDLRNLYLSGPSQHQFVKQNDYIVGPRTSGYRGIHLVYEYRSSKYAEFDGLKIEIQLRSRLQHAWATAVETVGTYIDQALKASFGPEEWLHFFLLMSAYIAEEEDCPPVPGVDYTTVHEEIIRLERELDVLTFLQALQRMTEIPMELEDAKLFLLILEPKKQKVTIEGFRGNQLVTANKRYLELERSSSGELDTVLVRSESVAALRKAFPNYFQDVRPFVDALREAIGPHAQMPPEQSSGVDG